MGTPTCVCKNPAVCLGIGEHGASYGCDTCCGHCAGPEYDGHAECKHEDGRCVRLSAIPDLVSDLLDRIAAEDRSGKAATGWGDDDFMPMLARFGHVASDPCLHISQCVTAALKVASTEIDRLSSENRQLRTRVENAERVS